MVVVGIGVNVSTTRAELPVPEATSLELAGGTPVDRSRLLGAILGHFGERYSDWLSVGGDAAESFLQADYRARCATLNRPVVVTPVVGSPYRGLATDIDDQGRLLVFREAGGLEQLPPPMFAIFGSRQTSVIDTARPACAAGQGGSES